MSHGNGNNSSCVTKAVYFVTILGVFLIMYGLVRIMIHYTRPAPVGVERVALRLKNMADYKAATAEAINNYGWVDPVKGIVRLPMDRAMELTVREWQNPAAARSNLIERVTKATALPPKPPEKPNVYE